MGYLGDLASIIKHTACRMIVARHRDILDGEETIVALSSDNTGEILLQRAHIVEMDLVTLTTLTSPATLILVMTLAAALVTNRMVGFNFLHHFLLLIIICFLKTRTVLYSL